MKKRLFNKNFNREHVKAHQNRDLKDTILDLAEELQEKELRALEYERSWKYEKDLRITITTELGREINNLALLTQKKVKQALIVGGLLGVAVGGLAGYLMRAYSW
ncbi:MAG: hypothetical protein WA118_08705 [Carboxydocellales bacterium]